MAYAFPVAIVGGIIWLLFSVQHDESSVAMKPSVRSATAVPRAKSAPKKANHVRTNIIELNKRWSCAKDWISINYPLSPRAVLPLVRFSELSPQAVLLAVPLPELSPLVVLSVVSLPELFRLVAFLLVLRAMSQLVAVPPELPVQGVPERLNARLQHRVLRRRVLHHARRHARLFAASAEPLSRASRSRRLQTTVRMPPGKYCARWNLRCCFAGLRLQVPSDLADGHRDRGRRDRAHDRHVHVHVRGRRVRSLCPPFVLVPFP